MPPAPGVCDTFDLGIGSHPSLSSIGQSSDAGGPIGSGLMRVLVIGGTGFIGASAVRKLAAQGDAVVCFDRVVKPDQFADYGDRVLVMSGDVTRIEEIWAVIREQQIE